MKNTKKCFLAFMILMIGLGAGDAMRGVFSDIFSNHFSLNAGELSKIVTVSYIGNLFFLAAGGCSIDKMNKKRAMQILILLWTSSQLLFALTDNFMCILIGMFFAMGTSTLLNTTINLVTPVLFVASPGFLVNFLFFVQGIGTSTSQSVIGNWAKDFSYWHKVNWILIVIGVIAFVLTLFCDFGKKEKKEKNVSVKGEIFTSKFIIMVLMLGYYFIAEHGMLNWMVMYATKGLSISKGMAANYTAIFFGGITIGRLVLSFLVDKLGVLKSLRYFSVVACVFFCLGVFGGKSTVMILALSGILFSILYPTIIMSVGKLWPQEIVSSVSGLIISIASVADIAFNAVFGSIADHIGYKSAFMILPVCMIIYAASMFMFSRKYETK